MSCLISIVYHSGLSKLQATLDSLPLADADLTVAILDVSADHEAEALAREYSVVVEWAPRNGGFSWGHHRVFDNYGQTCDTFVCLNPDVTFLDGSFQKLLGHLERRCGVFYALQLVAPGEPAPYSIHDQLSPSQALSRWLGPGREARLSRLDALVRQTFHGGNVVRLQGMSGSGALIAMKAKVWRDSGGLDPDFFLFGEDREFGHRLSRLGIPSFLCGDVTVLHPGGFRTGGLSQSGSTEVVVSEQLYWIKTIRSPQQVLLAIQVLGILGRTLRGISKRDRQSTAAWFGVLVFRLRNLSSSKAAARGPDGIRVSANRRPFEVRA